MILTAAEFASEPTRLPLVLLVEDHQDTRQMYAEFLAVTFDVMTADDGSQALELMRTRQPELLIHRPVAARPRRVRADQAATAFSRSPAGRTRLPTSRRTCSTP